MKKALSILLAAVMLFTVALPAFAEEGSRTATFQAPSAGLITTNPDGQDIGPAYYFVKTENGRPTFVEDPNGKYYLANDGYYHTEDELIDIPAGAKTYSPETYATGVAHPITSGTDLSFMVFTNEAYNAASAYVYINGVKATMNDVGEYVVYVDRDFNISVKDDALTLNMYSVILTSGKGYSVKTLQGQNYAAVPYGGEFRFRVKLANGYSDADLSVSVTRGTSDLAEFLGEDADLLNKVMNSEKLVSDGVDSEGCRTYTIRNITSECKVSVSGVRENKKADILTYFKRIIKMILDVFHIDTSFVGLDVIDLSYYTVNIDDSGIGTADLDYTMVTGTVDPFKMTQFNVMAGESVTIEFVTYDESIVRYSDIYGAPGHDQRLRVTWTGGNEGGTYGNVWIAHINRATGKTYYTTTFMIDNITATTNVTVSVTG